MKKAVVGLLAILFVIVAFYITQVAEAGWERCVPSDYSTIQAAINAASDGDVVIVANGTYTGTGNKNLDFGGKEITVVSENGPANCIIDCQNSGRGFYFHSGEGNDSVVEGFTIRNGSTSQGSAIYIGYSSSPTIKNCEIHSNSTWYDYAGAIMCYWYSSPKIIGCSIWNNSANWSGGAIACYSYCNPEIANCMIYGNSSNLSGGGIWCYDHSSPTIEKCSIISNTAGTEGGGIYCWSYCNPTIKECDISYNQATNSDGGGCFFSNADPNLISCQIKFNSCSNGRGAGIFCYWDSDPNIVNCTIVFNSAGTQGGGIWSYYYCDPVLKNSIIWFNNAPTGNEIYVYAATTTLQYCDYDNRTNDVFGTVNASNCIHDNPNFLNPGSSVDCHLKYGSPCIDQGSNALLPGGASLDMDGFQRVTDYDNNATATVDMGAFEMGKRICDSNEDYLLNDPVFLTDFGVDYSDPDDIPDALDIISFYVCEDANYFRFKAQTNGNISNVFSQHGSSAQICVFIDTDRDCISDKFVLASGERSDALLLNSDIQTLAILQRNISGSEIEFLVPKNQVGDNFNCCAVARFALPAGDPFDTSHPVVSLAPVVDITSDPNGESHVDTVFFQVQENEHEIHEEEMIRTSDVKKLPANKFKTSIHNKGERGWLLKEGYYPKNKYRVEMYVIRDGGGSTFNPRHDYFAKLVYEDKNGNSKWEPDAPNNEKGGWIVRCPYAGGKGKEQQIYDLVGGQRKLIGIYHPIHDPDDTDTDGRKDFTDYTYGPETNRLEVYHGEKSLDSQTNKSYTKKVYDKPHEKANDVKTQKRDLFEITTESLPDGVQNQEYKTTTMSTNTHIFTAEDSLKWDKSGNWPTGLELKDTTGVISGTTSATGQFAFTISVIYSYPVGTTTTKSREYTITVHPELKITTTTLDDAYVGSQYGDDVLAEGGERPYKAWKIIEGQLPPGMIIKVDTDEPETGQGWIEADSVAPEAVPEGENSKVWTFKVEVEDKNGYKASKQLSITVYKNPPGGG